MVSLYNGRAEGRAKRWGVHKSENNLPTPIQDNKSNDHLLRTQWSTSVKVRMQQISIYLAEMLLAEMPCPLALDFGSTGVDKKVNY